MRGRGGCYKHTFYGITRYVDNTVVLYYVLCVVSCHVMPDHIFKCFNKLNQIESHHFTSHHMMPPLQHPIISYQCMEATPSLACANKCVFCWRHHKNPVGTEWRYVYPPVLTNVFHTDYKLFFRKEIVFFEALSFAFSFPSFIIFIYI